MSLPESDEQAVKVQLFTICSFLNDLSDAGTGTLNGELVDDANKDSPESSMLRCDGQKCHGDLFAVHCAHRNSV